MKRLFIIGLLIIVWQAKAQVFSGQIFMRENASDLFLNRAYVTNLSTQFTTLSGYNGEFSIPAKEGDVIRFTSIITERQDFKIKPDNLSRKSNFVQLKPAYHQIEEIVIKFKPTGDIRKDVMALRSAEKPLKVAELIGLPEPVGDGYSPQEPVAALKDGGFSINVQTIYDAISGDAAKKKRLKNFEIMDSEISAVKNYYGVEYFKKLKIPANLIDNFIQFVYLSDNIKIYIMSKNLEGVKPYIEKYLPIYLERVQNSHLTGQSSSG